MALVNKIFLPFVDKKVSKSNHAFVKEQAKNGIIEFMRINTIRVKQLERNSKKILEVNAITQDYQKLRELENNKNVELVNSMAIRQSHPGYGRRDMASLEQKIAEDEGYRLDCILEESSEKFHKMRSCLERKYKFEFSVDAYGDKVNGFSKEFKDRFLSDKQRI